MSILAANDKRCGFGEEVFQLSKKMIQVEGQRPIFGNRSRRCLHGETDAFRIFKNCMRGHKCWHCSFDQGVEEMDQRENVVV